MKDIVRGKVLCLINNMYIVELESKEIGQVYIGDIDNVFIMDKEKYIGQEYEFSKKSNIDRYGLKYELVRENIQVDEKVAKDLTVGKVIEVNKFIETRGGLIFNYEGIEGFIPKSEITHKFIKDLDHVAREVNLNETKKVEIIEVKYRKGSNVEIVGSIKSLEMRAIDKFKADNKESDIISASILEVKSMGLILMLTGGVTALLHENEMSDDMRERYMIMDRHDEVKVRIEKFDNDKVLISSKI